MLEVAGGELATAKTTCLTGHRVTPDAESAQRGRLGTEAAVVNVVVVVASRLHRYESLHGLDCTQRGRRHPTVAAAQPKAD